MKNIFKNSLKIAAVLVASSIASMTFAEDNICPTLTASDVQGVIDSHASKTLDFYYFFDKDRVLDNQKYDILVGFLPAKNASEARNQAKKILLTGEESFSGVFSKEYDLCVYKKVTAPLSSKNTTDTMEVSLKAWPSSKNETLEQTQKFLIK